MLMSAAQRRAIWPPTAGGKSDNGFTRLEDQGA